MGVFICWSGENSRSKQIAEILRDRIPEILQTAEPFLSAVDVGAGTVWMDELKAALKNKSFGILCITPENKDNPWIHFEAGALWRTEEDRRVCPLLFDVRPAEVTGPLSQLQCKQLHEHGFFEVMKEVNQFGASTKIDESVLRKTFTRVWPDIEADISKVKKPLNLVKPHRQPNEMIEEILTIVRSLRRDVQIKPPSIAEIIRHPSLMRFEQRAVNRELKALGLTNPEAEVLYWITEGKTTPEIAIIMDASLDTVKKHQASAYAKLGLAMLSPVSSDAPSYQEQGKSAEAQADFDKAKQLGDSGAR